VLAVHIDSVDQSLADAQERIFTAFQAFDPRVYFRSERLPPAVSKRRSNIAITSLTSALAAASNVGKAAGRCWLHCHHKHDRAYDWQPRCKSRKALPEARDWLV